MEQQHLTNEQQISAMHLHFPHLRLKRRDICLMIWEGSLRPSFVGFPYLTMSTYLVRIVYTSNNIPTVRVLDPILIKGTPHLNYDKTLCLYYAVDKNWGPEKFIAKTIIPWTLEWLLCYEIWQITKKWYGAEAPH